MRRGRRRRAAVMLVLALACGGLAASEVERDARSVQARVGPLVPVIVARHDLRAGIRLRPSQLALRKVPQRFVPPDALAATAEATGGRLAVALPAGGYLTAAALDHAAASGSTSSPRPGERAIDVAVAAGADLGTAGPGTRVDVLVTTEGASGHGRSYVALEDVELLGARPPDAGGGGRGGDGAAAHATAIATLRVSVREAVFLTAAQSFAREIRLLVRPPGERHGSRGAVVDGRSL